MKTSKQRLLSVLALIALAPLTFALMTLAHAAPPVTVTAAEPSSAQQGTVALDVVVTGSGFDSTAAVNFLVTGTTNPGGVTVKKVTFNSSKKLTATIEVADNAIVNKFDIEVVLSQGRKGKGTSLFSVAKKAGPAPVQVPPPGSCSGAPGVFPAFAYVKVRSHIERRGNRNYRVFDGTDAYLANSTGSCSVLVAIDASVNSYRQIGNEARIAYSHGSEVRLLKFQVDNGNVVPTAPLILYTGTDPYCVCDVELSADGRTLYFSDEFFKTADETWMDTVKSIDITSCTANCTPVTLLTLVDSGMAGLSISPADDRLYMAIHHRIPDLRSISFMEKQAGVWSSTLRHVVTDQDTDYATVDGLSGTALGQWDYDGTGSPRAVLVVHIERAAGNTSDIFDVSNCGFSGTQSCYASGEISVVRTGIAGHPGSFTSMPSLGDPAPNLLVGEGDWRNLNELVKELDLDSLTVIPVVAGGSADSAD